MIDGREVPRGSTVETDLCIIGAGPAGITVARECLDSGLSICLLESGGIAPQDVPRDLSAGESTGYRYYNLARTRMRAFGGTSHYWLHDVGLRARPLDPIDFEIREGVASSGWPFDMKEMEHHYVRAQEICGLGPFRYDAPYWIERSTYAPLSAAEALDTPVFQFGSDNMFPGHYDLFRSAPNLRLYTFSTVTEMIPDHRADRVERLRVITIEGAHYYVSARIYVLAAGGIENPRLLLLSRGASPAGLGNEHDLVGRSFMEHLALRTGYLHPPRPQILEEAGFYLPHDVEGTRIQGMVRVPPATLREEGLRNAAFFLDPVSNPQMMTVMARLRLWLMTKPRGVFPAATALQLLRDPASLGEYGMSAIQHLRGLVWSGENKTLDRLLGSLSSIVERQPSAFQLKVMAEQSPDPNSRVVLGRRRDRYGNPLPNLQWRISTDDVRSIRRCQDLVDRAFRDSGWEPMQGKLPKIPADQPLFHGQWHHMGTTRMHEHASQGVVDSDGRVHTVENLYVAGSSVFPTGGYANPTLTIVALSVRLAEHLKRMYCEKDTPPTTPADARGHDA